VVAVIKIQKTRNNQQVEFLVIMSEFVMNLSIATGIIMIVLKIRKNHQVLFVVKKLVFAMLKNIAMDIKIIVQMI